MRTMSLSALNLLCYIIAFKWYSFCIWYINRNICVEFQTVSLFPVSPLNIIKAIFGMLIFSSVACPTGYSRSVNASSPPCYKLHTTPLSWYAARNVCTAEGGMLAVLDLWGVQDAVVSTFWLNETYVEWYVNVVVAETQADSNNRFNYNRITLAWNTWVPLLAVTYA